MRNYTVGFSIAAILALAIFFFYIVPERKKVEEKIEAAYQKGLNEAVANTDTVLIPGKPIIEYRDTSYSSNNPVNVEKNDTTFYLITSADSTFISGKDEIGVQSTVSIDIEIKDGKPLLDLVPDASWFFRIRHKDFEQTPDTVVIEVPKFIKEVQLEDNWMLITLSYIGGALTALLLFLISGI